MCLTDGLLQAYVDGEVEAAERDRVLAHLAGCSHCRGRAEARASRRRDIDRLLAGAGSTTANDAGAGIALARFRARATARPALHPGARAAAAAAVVLIVVVLGLFVGSRGRSHTPRAAADVGRTEQGRIERPAPISRGTPGEPVAQPTPPQDVNRQAGRQETPTVTRVRPALQTAPPHQAPAQGAYFLQTADSTPPEIGVVVRVKVPLSWLTGDPGPTFGGDEPAIDFDVLVGQDGRPRAILFVNPTQPIGGK
jgi:hypothetical protein